MVQINYFVGHPTIKFIEKMINKPNNENMP